LFGGSRQIRNLNHHYLGIDEFQEYGSFKAEIGGRFSSLLPLMNTQTIELDGLEIEVASERYYEGQDCPCTLSPSRFEGYRSGCEGQ